NRVPWLARRTRQKYSPSSSPKSCVFHGPAASVNRRLVSHVAVCIQTLCPIFRSNHSTGDRSHQSDVGTKSARWGRYMNFPHAEDNSSSSLAPCSTASICLAIL